MVTENWGDTSTEQQMFQMEPSYIQLTTVINAAGSITNLILGEQKDQWLKNIWRLVLQSVPILVKFLSRHKLWSKSNFRINHGHGNHLLTWGSRMILNQTLKWKSNQADVRWKLRWVINLPIQYDWREWKWVRLLATVAEKTNEHGHDQCYTLTGQVHWQSLRNKILQV